MDMTPTESLALHMNRFGWYHFYVERIRQPIDLVVENK
jgi:hypothetical protein